MYYSQSANIVLLRVPKTGSSSAQNIISSAYQDSIENGGLHETYAEMRCRIKSDFFQRQHWRIVGFVRHPIAWFDSMVAQFWEDGVFAGRWFGGGLKRFDGPDLASQLLLHMDRTPFSWFTNTEGVVKVNEVWRMEDMAKFAMRFHVPPLHLNPTPAATKRTLDWTPEQLEIIKLRFARELKFYPEGL